jgi:hypothetical protein
VAAACCAWRRAPARESRPCQRCSVASRGCARRPLLQLQRRAAAGPDPSGQEPRIPARQPVRSGLRGGRHRVAQIRADRRRFPCRLLSTLHVSQGGRAGQAGPCEQGRLVREPRVAHTSPSIVEVVRFGEFVVRKGRPVNGVASVEGGLLQLRPTAHPCTPARVRRLASVGADNVLRLWHSGSGEAVAELPVRRRVAWPQPPGSRAVAS